MLTDLEMMQKQGTWPRWPILPLKRNNNPNNIECGFLVSYKGKSTTVVRGDMYNANIKTLEEFFTKYETKEYPSYEAIIADGWIID